MCVRHVWVATQKGMYITLHVHYRFACMQLHIQHGNKHSWVETQLEGCVHGVDTMIKQKGYGLGNDGHPSDCLDCFV